MQLGVGATNNFVPAGKQVWCAVEAAREVQVLMMATVASRTASPGVIAWIVASRMAIPGVITLIVLSDPVAIRGNRTAHCNVADQSTVFAYILAYICIRG